MADALSAGAPRNLRFGSILDEVLTINTSQMRTVSWCNVNFLANNARAMGLWGHLKSGAPKVRRERQPETSRSADDKARPIRFNIAAALIGAAALLVVDLVFVTIHISHKSRGVPSSDSWRIDLDRTYPEAFQYVKFAGIAACLVVIARSRHIAAAVPWAVIFALFAVDDALSIHERISDFAGYDLLKLPMVAGLRPTDSASLLLAGAVGVVILISVVRSWRSGDGRSRWLHLRMSVLLIAFAAFAVVADAIHMLSAMADTRGTGLLEDGGEMLVASVTLAFLVGVAAERNEVPTAGADLRREAPG